MAFELVINRNEQYPVITLKNLNNGSSAIIYAFGGIVNVFTVALNDGLLNIIDGFSSVNDAVENVTNGFKGSFLSPFTCRMNKGEFRFNSSDYKINKFYLQAHAIHGILYDAAYNIIATEANDDEASVTLTYQYKGDDKGYPFAFNITHQWVLKPNNHLSVITTLQHSNEQAIPYAQGWHPYFTLGGLVDEYWLQFDSNTMLEFDESLLPTCNRITTHQFENGCLLNGLFLDNCFALNTSTSQSSCKITYKNICLTIMPDASYPYLQVYTPPHRKSIAIENLSGAPDCFNNGIGLSQIEPHISTIFTTSYFVSEALN